MYCEVYCVLKHCPEKPLLNQALDTVYVGPVPEGRHMFVFQVPSFLPNM